MMNKGKIWKYLLVFLLLANLALTTWVLFSMKKRPHPPHSREERKTALIEALKLNKEQIRQYNSLVEQHFDDMDQLHQQKNDCMHALLQLTMNPSIDSIRYKKLISQSAALEIKMDSMMFAHFSSIYKMCNLNQQANFEKVLENAIAPPKKNPGHGNK
jgi:Spy/CpxP family protein refolding chaperone